MATPYSNIFERFDRKVTDFDLYDLAEQDEQLVKTNLLNSAIIMFMKSDKDLHDKDDTSQQFNIDLTPVEEEIIASYMTIQWLEPFMKHIDNLEHYLNTREFRVHSPANKVRAIKELYQFSITEAEHLEVKYETIDAIGLWG